LAAVIDRRYGAKLNDKTGWGFAGVDEPAGSDFTDFHW
jgi:hypothetical protein